MVPLPCGRSGWDGGWGWGAGEGGKGRRETMVGMKTEIKKINLKKANSILL